MWKKFTVSLLLIACATLSKACVFVDNIGTPGTYMFKSYGYEKNLVYGYDEYSVSSNVAFWLAYTKGLVDSATIERALYECSVKDIENGSNAFFAYLKSIGDADALRYWTINKSVSSKIDDPWYYPSRSEKQEMMRLANEVDGIMRHCAPQLKERYLFVLMRISYYLQHYTICTDIWEKHNLAWTDKALKQKCQLYYAGALLNSGNATKAADIYGDNADWESLKYLDKSVDFMNELYAASPNSKAFNFFVQDYLNNLQDKGLMPGMDDFEALCKKAASDKKCKNTALWQSALAHLAFLDGDVEKAVKLIEKAATMKDDTYIMDNVRMLRLLYHATNTSASNYDELLYMDLPWLMKKTVDLDKPWPDEKWGYNHCLNMLARTILRNAVPHYDEIGNSNMAAALLNAYDEVYCYDREYRAYMRSDTVEGSFEYSTHFFAYLDKTSIQNVKNFLAFVKSGGKTAFEKSIIKLGYVRESMMNELIGTKYMRDYNYDSAIVYLEKVQPSYWRKLNVTPYLDRNPFEEVWIATEKFKGLPLPDYNAAKEYAANPTKLQFCRIMQNLDRRQRKSHDNAEKAALHYLLAVGMVQSVDWSWALTQYHRSVSYSDLYNPIVFLEDNGEWAEDWNYKSSPSYEFQNRYKSIESHIAEAEKLSKDIELSARCQYLGFVVDIEQYSKRQHCRSMMDKYGNTALMSSESRHCPVLADYR